MRRKSSFIRRIDSSEECPSPHGSIYEAYYFSTTNTSDESFNRIEQMGTDIPMAQLRTLDMTNPVVRNDLTTQIPEFKYGHGTVLDTIMEKKSSGTIRSLYRPRSADDVKKAPFLCHRDSFLVSKSPRRKHSFSLDDLQLVNRSYHEVCHEIYASPKVCLQSFKILEPLANVSYRFLSGTPSSVLPHHQACPRGPPHKHLHLPCLEDHTIYLENPIDFNDF